MSLAELFGGKARERADQPHIYRDKELTYAAWSRCPCGAGLAHVNNGDVRGYWDCSDILTGRAIPSGQEGATQHTGQMPFAFWKVIPETSPRAEGMTTRPKQP